MNPTKREHFDLDLEHKNFSINYEIFQAEKRLYEKELWGNNRFCECGAETAYTCSCDLEKWNRFMRRRKRKVREKFGKRINQVFRGQMPTVD